MRIDDNAEALAMMKRALGSLEAKIREAYNKGYQDGVKSKNPKHGYMWICPNCQLEVHSDFENCPRCGWSKTEPTEREGE